VPRGVPAVREGKPLKGEPQERRRCETEPAGSRGEQGVRRLRKPGGAAQPGEANPVQVAPRHLMRCRGERPHERDVRRNAPLGSFSASSDGATRHPRDLKTGTFSGRCARTDGPARVTLWSRAKSTRGFVVSSSVRGDPGAAERPRRPTSREVKAREESSTSRAIPRSLATL
jgi:hypothetical protein